MTSVIKILFLVILKVIYSSSRINDFIPCYDGETNIIPMNISNYMTSSFLRINMIFTEENFIKGNKKLKLSVSKIGLLISGKITDIYLDLNTNFSNGDQKLVISYECNEIEFMSPSINKFWQMTMDLEIHMKCIIKDKEVFYKDFDFSPNLNIVIPVSNISKPSTTIALLETSEYSSNKFIEILADNIRSYDYKSISKDDFNEKNFVFELNEKFELSFFENEYYENNEFYLFNGDNPIQCRARDSYIFINRYLISNNDDFKIIKDFLSHFRVDLEKEVTSISYNQNNNLKLFRNFEVIDFRDQYEKLITIIGSRSLHINIIILFLSLIL